MKPKKALYFEYFYYEVGYELPAQDGPSTIICRTTMGLTGREGRMYKEKSPTQLRMGL